MQSVPEATQPQQAANAWRAEADEHLRLAAAIWAEHADEIRMEYHAAPRGVRWADPLPLLWIEAAQVAWPKHP